MRTINEHIIHCSDSDFGDVEIIRHWHLARGFKDIGYHFVIRQDGEIELGRPLEQMGAHCAGYNRHSVGTCLIGKSGFTPAQFEALQKLHMSLSKLFTGIRAVPHNVHNPHKTCPNFNIYNVLKEAEK
tara:strand:+ start:976 stop:1359 length:384 start_codon:yes stop_codon:yes gene_type:complete